MTYDELLKELQGLTSEQLGDDVLIELGHTNATLEAEFRICSAIHPLLPQGYPVLWISH